MGVIAVPINNAPANMPNICIQNITGCGGYLDNSLLNITFLNLSIDNRNFYNESRINQTINDNLNSVYGNLSLKVNKSGDNMSGNLNINGVLLTQTLCIYNCSNYKVYYNGTNIITEVYI
jgi:hypothetical protein